MIKVDNIHKSYGKQVLFNGLGFSVNKREKIGLVGRNGHGKTTLFQMILGYIQPDEGIIAMPKHYRIGHLSQHIKFTKDTVLVEACLGLKKDQVYESWKAEKILSGLGFSENDMQKHPGEFSGGYQIRLNLAKLILSEPDMLLLDEPNNYLDIVAIRWLEGFLKGWRGELILVTHDRSFMDSIITHTVAIHRNKARKVEGNTEKLYSQIASEEEIHEKTRLNEEKKRKKQEIFIRRFRAKARLGGMVQSRIKQLEKQGKKEVLSKIEELDFSFSSAYFPGDQMMSAEGLSFSYTGKEPYLINNFSIDIGTRERICIIGKNGKGKTTLLKLLSGGLKPLKGGIKSHPVLRTGYFGQTNRIDLDDSNSIVDEIMSSDTDCSMQRARAIAGGLMFQEETALKKISVLSGGEKNRVLLAKILVKPCHLLFLDEPTNHLDMQSSDALLEAVKEFNGSFVMVTHNEMFLNRLATRLIVFDDDRVFMFRGKYSDFLKDVGWKDEGIVRDVKKDSASGKDNYQDKKAAKKTAARLRQERSDILGPLKDKIRSLEKRITGLENELHLNTHALVEASFKGDAAKIEGFSKKTHALRSQIESFYDELDKTTCECEKKESEFDSKLKELADA